MPMEGTAMTGAKGGNRGMTMIELLIVVGLLGLLYVILSNAYQGWSEKYRVETAVKEMFADLMDARGRAMLTNRPHFVTLTTSPARYLIYEDTNPAPDGNGLLESTDTAVRTATVRYPITVSPAGTATLSFNRDGLLSMNTGTAAYIRLTSPVSADYDCITLGPTRIKMGKFNEATNACVER